MPRLFYLSIYLFIYLLECVVSLTFACWFDPNSSGELAEIIIYIIPLE